jgi:hypothetical protein
MKSKLERRDWNAKQRETEWVAISSKAIRAGITGAEAQGEEGSGYAEC